jgi:hypothetical protein
MTDSNASARGGLSPWAKWSIGGCVGCLAIVMLVVVGGGIWFWQTIGKNVNIATFDVSGKPDLPLAATAAQLVPPRVGSFVRQRVAPVSAPGGGTAGGRGWRGDYASGSQRVTLTVMPTSAAKSASGRDSPFAALQRQSQRPNTAVHMRMKIRDQTTDMVFWEKPNWTFMVQSPAPAALPFAQAYQPAAGKGK